MFCIIISRGTVVPIIQHIKNSRATPPNLHIFPIPTHPQFLLQSCRTHQLSIYLTPSRTPSF
ncbi:hypothetical protein BKA69DRAFT_1094450 [Paraphysoderma sedebokerense]|nr:hypothetical protein BKA69DRAFT_1094450 [Paraphysoderma sedebokerense]